MDCPFCPSCQEYVNRPRARVSVWAPLALIAVVLFLASLASTLAGPADPATRAAIVAVHGRAL